MRKRSKYSLSHYKLLTANMGKLIPVSAFEVLPGDSMQHMTAMLTRVAPLATPVMHPVKARIHHFYVPYRLIWEDAEDFFTGGEDGTSKPTVPYKNNPTITEGSLWDYLGVPPATYAYDLNILYLRAYQMIWREYYRDQQLDTEPVISTASGADTTTAEGIQNVSWEKDYFTTARSDSQLGSSVSIPLAGSAPVEGSLAPKFTIDGSGDYALRSEADGTLSTSASPGSVAVAAWSDPRLTADLSAATGMTINDLRWALGVQAFQEMMNKGSRYEDLLMAAFNVKGLDNRLQNPEYLGGGRQVLNFSEIMATDGTNTGDLYGHGIGAMRTNKYRRFFQEHGVILSLMSVVPKSIYAQALPKFFIKTTKEDWYTRQLEFVGDMPITNAEVYAMHSAPTNTFGYQSIYDDYREIHSGIAGEFRSTLDDWHMARIHTGDVALNSSYTNCVPTDRVYKSTATDQLYCMANHSIQARRILQRNPRARII